MLESTFKEIAGHYSADTTGIDALWKEIQAAHSHTTRRYHNLLHLEHLFSQLLPVKEWINDWDMMVFAISYHDIVYNTLKQDNEEKSSALAAMRLGNLPVPWDRINACRTLIMATKSHKTTPVADASFFTDADLSILGADPDSYNQYSAQIRKEYKFYPDLAYKPGRRKVLEHFLHMDRIFKTAHFHALYEAKARQNLQAELHALAN
ncbi:MAG TPA: hypothetical protein PLQ32_04275 [Flavihumibacter sp.]|nr:hypothetical protein [Flavihumibacter sp.]HQD08018.1 hypothetical protein [Flavihumibacter sp.]